MSRIKYLLFSVLFAFGSSVSAQEEVKEDKQQGHINNNKFR